MAHTPTPEPAPRRMRPLLIVGGIAIAGFLVALVAFRGSGSTSAVRPPATVADSQPSSAPGQGSGCGTGQPDSTYSVSVTSEPSPPRAEGTTFHLTVRRDGKAVTGATVCLTADMTEMHHAGINNGAKETSGGEYDATLKFGMRGPYAGTVIVAEPGKGAVSVPITFPVN